MGLTNTDKILIITSASTGNNIFCTPAIHLIRKHLPNATIDVVALNKLSAEVFLENTDINQLFVSSKSRDINKIATKYSKIIVLNKNALKKLSDIQPPFVLVPSLSTATHQAEHLLQFVAQLLEVVVMDVDRHYVIQTQQTAQSLLAKFNLQATTTLINIHLGCGTTVLHGWKFFYAKRADDKKLWSIDAYIALGNALMQAISDLRITITGTSNESFLAKKFEKNVPNTINLVGKTTVSDLRALMQRADLFIAHDCGVFHIAAASVVPIVGLYGPTNPVTTGPYPYKPQHTLIKKEQMAEITVEEVVAAATQLLEKFPRLAKA